MAPPAVMLSAGLLAYYGPIRASGRHRRVSFICPRLLPRPEGPQFTLPELDTVPPSLLRWLQNADRRVCTPGLAFAHPVRARQPHLPHFRTSCGLLTKRQHSLNAAARHLASPAPVGTFTAELACGWSLFRTSAMTTWALVSLMTRLSLAAQEALWATHRRTGETGGRASRVERKARDERPQGQ